MARAPVLGSEAVSPVTNLSFLPAIPPSSLIRLAAALAERSFQKPKMADTPVSSAWCPMTIGFAARGAFIGN